MLNHLPKSALFHPADEFGQLHTFRQADGEGAPINVAQRADLGIPKLPRDGVILVALLAFDRLIHACSHARVDGQGTRKAAIGSGVGGDRLNFALQG
jgi:hypothetical protein